MEPPEEFFIFVDRTSLMTRNNLDITGGFSSRCAGLLMTPEGVRAYESGAIDLLPFRQNPDQYSILSPYVVRLTTEQWIEWEAERLRQALCPAAPSRLSGIYAFGDRQSCLNVASRYGWDLSSVRRFKVVSGPFSRFVRVNMEVVSLMRAVYPLGMISTEDSERVWSHYWSGGAEMQFETPGTEGFTTRKVWDSGAIWEWLIEGRVELVDPASEFGATP